MLSAINFWILVLFVSSASCEYYSSVSGLEVLLKAEMDFLKTIDGFLVKNQVTFVDQIAKIISHIGAQVEEAANDSSGYVNNPINAFKLIKRFVSDWSVVDEYVKAEFPDAGLGLHLDVFNGSFRPPTDDDLNGAAKGLARLTETYKLKISDLASGIIKGRKYGSEMSASDCLEVGMSLYIVKEYRRAIPWLLEAMVRFKKAISYNKDAMAELLHYLSVAFYQAGNAKMALVLTHDALQINPADVDLLENKKVYLERLSLDRSVRKIFKQPPEEQEAQEPSVEKLYEMTCRGERHQTPSEQRPLRCMYQTNGRPYRLLSPFKVEQLSIDPPIVYYHDVLDQGIIAKLIHEGERNLNRSKIGNSSVSDIRTSKTGWLYFENHDFLSKIATLLQDVTELNLATAGALQIVNYGIGGHYGPHWDFSDDPIKIYGEWRGNRIATALFYLNDVELGGGTAFPFLKLTVPPVKRSLVLWYNLHESLEPDFRTKHAGCPVLKGSKWILNEWFHERGQDFTRPCSLDQQGEVSRHLEHVK